MCKAKSTCPIPDLQKCKLASELSVAQEQTLVLLETSDEPLRGRFGRSAGANSSVLDSGFLDGRYLGGHQVVSVCEAEGPRRRVPAGSNRACPGDPSS